MTTVSQRGNGTAGVTHTSSGSASIPSSTAVQMRCRKFVSRSRNTTIASAAAAANTIDLIEISIDIPSQFWARVCMANLRAIDVFVFGQPRPWQFSRPIL